MAEHQGKLNGRGLLVGASLLAIMVPAMPAFAQAGEAAGSAGIEEITVTARKRQESLQDTPIAISAVTSDGLVQRGIDNVTQIGDFTPNVKFNSSMPISASNATAAIFIRGIGQNDYQLSADPGVGLYLDGVYISRGVGNVLDTLNVERIEVLRGPQGTLFGRNTIGGAVSVVTKKPGKELAGNLELTTGSYKRVQIKGSFDLPLGEGIYSSFSGFYHNRDGYVKGMVAGAPDLGDTNTLAGRFALRLEPSSDLSIDLAVDGTRSREESAPVVAMAIDETAPAAAYWNAAYSGAAAICTDINNPARLTNANCYNSQWVGAPYRSASTFQTVSSVFDNAGTRRYQSASDLNIWGVSGTVEWHLSDGITFKSITAYRKVTGFWTRESDHSPASIVQTKSQWTQDQFSQEIQFIGTALDSKLNWVLGGYYSKESGNHRDYVSIVDAVFLSGAVLKGRSTAAFAQATYEIVENLSLTGGVRWTEDKKTFGNDNQYVIEAGFLTGAPFNPDGSGLQNGDPLMGPLGSRATQKDKAWTPMASLSYRWSPEVLTYLSYSKGFKGGGFTQRVFPPFAFIPSFKPEKSTTYEFGMKTDLLDRKLRLNGALFWNDYSDLQVTVNDPSLGFAPIIQNAAKARIKGVELELQARPTEALRIEAGIGYLDAKYRSVDIHAGSLPGFRGIEHSDFKLIGPHASSAIYGLGMEAAASTAQFAGVLHGNPEHAPRPELVPPGINPTGRPDFQFELPNIFPNFLIHLAAGCGYPGMAFFTHQFWPLDHGRTLWEGINYFRPARNAAERIAQLHVNALHRNAWLEDTGTMEDTFTGIRSGAIDEMLLMDQEFLIRHAARTLDTYLAR